MIFKVMGLLFLLFFYSIYVVKMLRQKKKGIQTDQIAKGRKSTDVMRTEILMKIATYSIVVVEIISIIMSSTDKFTSLSIIGIVFCTAGDLIFFLAVHTMRDNWRAGIHESDKTEMVTSGICSFSRNPAFLGFDLVYIGILILFFNPVHLLFVIFAVTMLHLQIIQEERFLPIVFGKDYIKYKSRVCRYIGRKKAPAIGR
ncbi:MAG TPA: isoprenylcysteine carboxyl methyltransferase [Clostridiales bacterium]|nr:isoprenylcysteine carboxyl methyltransferase [Clostridiales bacterium]